MFKVAKYAEGVSLNWLTASVIILFHLLSIFAIFTFTWEGFAVFVITMLLTGSIGISFCYHRLLTHGSFKTNPFIKYFSTFCAINALEGGPLFWVATHRYHHKESDKPLDPHSPREGFLWAHVLWLFYDHPDLTKEGGYAKYAPDLYRDPVMRFINTFHFPLVLLTLAGIYGLGYWYGGPEMALSFLVWGGILRTVYVWHVTWLINSATHLWGYRNYESGDTSTNEPIIALLSFGEGWHNNHHGQQRSAAFGHRWFEFDLTYTVIAVLEKLRLVSDVVKPKKPEEVKTALQPIKEPAVAS